MRARIDEMRRRGRQSIRVTRAIFRAIRIMLKSIGFIEASSELFYVPGIVYWFAWWVVFVIVLVLPTYASEPFFIFPSALALVIAWLLGTSQYAQTLLATDFSVVRITPAAWSAFLTAFQSEGIEFPPEVLTAEAAEQAAKELERPLPMLVLYTLLRITSVAAMQALLAGCVGVLGILVGPTLAGVHWWHGWSPVSILYAVSVPTALSLLMYGLLPFVVARFLAVLRIR